MAKAARKAKTSKRERRERRFVPRATTNAGVVYALGAAGALGLGAGSWAQWGRVVLGSSDASLPWGWWPLAGGAVLTGAAIWFGTSGEPILSAGDGGVVVEKGGFFGTLPAQRIPWHQVESVTYDGASAAIVVKGRDEAGVELVVAARVASHPQAAAWIRREARERVPEVVEVGDEVALPEARIDAGERRVLEPLQVVGKRCASSGKIIAFEPDARVCPRCERVYHKDSVPETCACGGALREAAADEAKPAGEDAGEGAPAGPA